MTLAFSGPDPVIAPGREPIEEPIGIGIDALPGIAEGCGGREEQEEIERFRSQSPIEIDRAGNLRARDRGEGLLVEPLQQPIAQHPGGMEHPMDRTESAPSLVQGSSQTRLVRNIGGDGQGLAARPFDIRDEGILDRVAGQENEPRAVPFRQGPRDDPPDAAGRAGDQIDAAVAVDRCG